MQKLCTLGDSFNLDFEMLAYSIDLGSVINNLRQNIEDVGALQNTNLIWNAEKGT